ncbi:MAG: hypothetical protein [Bacteriophage sp.]|nr:MAG: hypothetical protein [Bacteriophage sp.]
MRILFHKGDIVAVAEVDKNDRAEGIRIGDIFEVVEYDYVPRCEPVLSKCKRERYAFLQDQLILIDRGGN